LNRFVFLTAAFLAAATAASFADEGWIFADTVLGRVDREAVTMADVRAEAAVALLEGAIVREPDLTARALMKRRLLMAEAVKLRFTASAVETAAVLAEMERAAGGPDVFRQWMADAGLSRRELERRAREIVLARRYLALRRETTYVPETEVRRVYMEYASVFGERSFSDVHDLLRKHLAAVKFRSDLDQWLEKQVLLGRAVMADGSAGGGKDAGR
jgi:hypothetical protein